MAKVKRARVNKRVEKQDEIKLAPTKRTVGVKPVKVSKEGRRPISRRALDQRNFASTDDR